MNMGIGFLLLSAALAGAWQDSQPNKPDCGANGGWADHGYIEFMPEQKCPRRVDMKEQWRIKVDGEMWVMTLTRTYNIETHDFDYSVKLERA